MVECVLSVWEAPGSIPSTKTNKKNLTGTKHDRKDSKELYPSSPNHGLCRLQGELPTEAPHLSSCREGAVLRPLKSLGQLLWVHWVNSALCWQRWSLQPPPSGAEGFKEQKLSTHYVWDTVPGLRMKRGADILKGQLTYQAHYWQLRPSIHSKTLSISNEPDIWYVLLINFHKWVDVVIPILWMRKPWLCSFLVEKMGFKATLALSLGPLSFSWLSGPQTAFKSRGYFRVSR